MVELDKGTSNNYMDYNTDNDMELEEEMDTNTNMEDKDKDNNKVPTGSLAPPAEGEVEEDPPSFGFFDEGSML